MYKVSVNDINELRTQTGAGMMECKNALFEAQGDFGKAIEILRKKGQKIAMNRLDRQASEGVVVSLSDENYKKAIIISLNCETDFVAKNQSFKDLAASIAKKALYVENTKELLQNSFDDNFSIQEKLIEQTGIIGEKLEIGAFEKLKAPFVSSYVHHNQKIASLVGLSSYLKGVEQVGEALAMQIAAMNPMSLDEKSLPAEIIEKEKEIVKEQLRKEGKPENMLDQIAQGKLKKFFSENTLIYQNFVKDPKITVGEFVKQFNKELQIIDFKRISI